MGIFCQTEISTGEVLHMEMYAIKHFEIGRNTLIKPLSTQIERGGSRLGQIGHIAIKENNKNTAIKSPITL